MVLTSRVASGLLALSVLLSACGGSDAPLAQGGASANRASVRAGAAASELRIEGKRADFTITATANGFDIKDNVGNRGTVSSNGASRLLFWDTSVALDTEGAAGQTYRLYQAAFARTPDVPGLSFWISAMDAGVPAATVAGGFMDSAEFKAAYGANVDNTTFVTKLYTNILGRAPEKSGLDFWVGALDKGFPRAEVLALVADSSENKSGTAAKIASGIAYTRSDVAYSATGNNIFPVAHAGQALQAAANTTVSLSGSGTDAEGAKLSYRWSLARPNGSIAKLAGADTATPSFKPDFTGDYILSLVVNDGKSDSAASTVKVSVTAGTFAERTVVLRFVGTDPSFGQEAIPGWPNASPVKDADGYSLYDIELSRNAESTPVAVRAYKFSGFNYTTQFNSAANASATMKASLVKGTELTGTKQEASANMVTALKATVDAIMAREQATRVVVFYSGHGNPVIFFEGMINMDQARDFISHVRGKTAGATLLLDFSTNCDVGFWDFTRYFHDIADYLIGSEKHVGGFSWDNIDVYFKHKHDHNLDRFLKSSNSTQAAFKAMVEARTGIWDNSKASIIANKAEQSLALYNLSEFAPYMKMIAARTDLEAERDLLWPTNDLGTWGYARNDAKLTAQFEAMRFSYTSNRHILDWKYDSRGFGVLEWYKFDPHLKTLR